MNEIDLPLGHGESFLNTLIMEDEYQKLMKSLAGDEDLDPAIEHFLKTAIKRNIWTGNRILQQKEAIPENIYFVIEGTARLCFFYTDDQYQVHKTTSAFVHDADFAFTLDSFFTQTPCVQSIELIGEGKIFAIGYQTIKEASARYLDMKPILDKIKNRYYQQLKERAYLLGMPLTKDRYYYLEAHKSWLFQRVPMEYIATYIGTTRENLTRIRSRYGGSM